MADEPTLRSRLKSRFRGTVLGAAVGDALGFPFEGSSRSFVMAIGSDAITHYEKHRSGYFPEGQYSDDTQMSLATIESIVEAGGVDGAGISAVSGRSSSNWSSPSPPSSSRLNGSSESSARGLFFVAFASRAGPENGAGNTFEQREHLSRARGSRILSSSRRNRAPHEGHSMITRGLPKDGGSARSRRVRCRSTFEERIL